MEEQSNRPVTSLITNYMRQRNNLFPATIGRIFSNISYHNSILYFTQLFLVFLLLLLFIELPLWKYIADDGTIDVFRNFLVTVLGGDLGVLILVVSMLTVTIVPFLVFRLFLRVLFPTFSHKYLEKEISRLTINHFVIIDRIMNLWIVIFGLITIYLLFNKLFYNPVMSYILINIFVFGSYVFIRENQSKYITSIFHPFEMNRIIQNVYYKDFKEGNLIDGNPCIKEGQLLKIQINPFPRDEKESSLVSILNLQATSKEAIVYEFYDEIIADKLRVDTNAIEVTIKKVHPFYMLDLELKRNFRFNYETEPDIT